MSQFTVSHRSFFRSLGAIILFLGMTCTSEFLFGQKAQFSIQSDETKGTKSLVETSSGKAIFKNCTSIEGLEFDTNDPEYYLIVSGKTVQLFQAVSKVTLLTKNVIYPEDCYEISDYIKTGKKIITFSTTSGRCTFLISSSQILYPKDQNADVLDITPVANTSEYLQVLATTVDKNYDQTVINWNGEQIMGPGKYSVIEFDSLNELFVIRKDKFYGAMDTSGNISIPFEYERLEYMDGFYIAQRKNRVGVITPTETILPFHFNTSTQSSSMPYYKGGIFYLPFEYEYIAIDTSKSTFNKINDFFHSYKTAEYYLLKYETVYEDREFADEEVVAHIINSETNQITVPNSYIIGLEHAPHRLSGGVGVIKDGKLGLMNIETGELMIPLEYEPVYLKDIYPDSRYHDNAFSLQWIRRDRKEITDDPIMLLLKKGGKFGIVDLKGKVLVPFIYEEIIMTEKCEEIDFIMVKQNGLYGLLDKNTLEMKIPCEYEYILDCHTALKFKSDKNFIKLQNGK